MIDNSKNETIQFYGEPILGTIKVPKIIATIKLCGGVLTFNITDTMQYEIPTKEQRENLKKTFGIEIELVNEK